MMLSVFSCICWPFIYLLRRYVYLGLPPNFWLGCLFFSFELHELLYILEINPSSDALFANILSHSEGFLFVMFMVFFPVQNILNLNGSCLFIFAFMFITYEYLFINLGGGSKKILVIYVKEYSAYVFSEFIVSDLKFRSLIHFEFIFVYGVMLLVLLSCCSRVRLCGNP